MVRQCSRIDLGMGAEVFLPFREFAVVRLAIVDAELGESRRERARRRRGPDRFKHSGHVGERLRRVCKQAASHVDAACNLVEVDRLKGHSVVLRHVPPRQQCD